LKGQQLKASFLIWPAVERSARLPPSLEGGLQHGPGPVAPSPVSPGRQLPDVCPKYSVMERAGSWPVITGRFLAAPSGTETQQVKKVYGGGAE